MLRKFAGLTVTGLLVSLVLTGLSASRAEPLQSDGSRPGTPPAASGQPPRIEDLACPAVGKKRMAWFIVYGRNGTHFRYDGPEFMTSQESIARKRALELAAEEGGASSGVTVTFGAFTSPCGFLYLENTRDTTYGLAQGSQESLARRRLEIERFGGRVVSPTVCPTDSAASVRVVSDDAVSARAYGSNPETGCAAANVCLDRLAAAEGRRIIRTSSVVGRLYAACDCQEAAGGMSYCTATGVKGAKPSPESDGVRG